MRTRILAALIGLAAALGLATAAAPAQAYLHVTNASNQCWVVTRADAAANGVAVNIGMYDSFRYADNDVVVRFGYRSPNSYYARFYDCRFIGQDDASGGVGQLSFQFAYSPWGTQSVPVPTCEFTFALDPC